MNNTKSNYIHALKPLCASVILAVTANAQAALFNPNGQTVFNFPITLDNQGKTDSDYTGIDLNGGSDNDTVTYNFNSDVSITLTNDTTDSNWSAYGVWVTNGVGSAALVNFNEALNITINGSSNMGVGLMTNSMYNPIPGGEQGQNNGTTVTLNGPVTMDISGNSVTAVVAGSHFNNNTNPGGKVVFGELSGENKHHIVVSSDWTDKANTSRNSDWAVGLLAFEDGDIQINGDMRIDLSVKNMQIVDETLTGEWADIAAAIFVGIDSNLNSSDSSVLDIHVEGNASGINRGDHLVALHGIVVGQHEAVQNYDQGRSDVWLYGDTNITLVAQGQKTESIYSGITTLGGAQFVSDGMVTINFELPEGLTLGPYTDCDSDVEFIGVSSGTYFKGTFLDQYVQAGNSWYRQGLIVHTPEGYNPALNNFIAAHSSNNHVGSNKKGNLYIDNSGSNAPIQLEGQIKTEYNGQIWLTLSGSQSYISGSAVSKNYAGRDGFIMMELHNGATWNVLENLDKDSDHPANKAESTIYSLKLTESGTLNLSRPKKYSQFYQMSDYQSVKIWDSLSGNNGLLIFDMNLAEETVENVYTDQVIVTKEATGSHEVNFNFINGLNGVAADKFHSENWIISQGEGSTMTLTGPGGSPSFTGRGMISLWSLAFVPEGEEKKLDSDEGRDSLTNTSNVAGHWYLIRENQNVPDPDLPPEIDQNITIGTSTGQALAYMADLEDLRKRIGEVRYGAQDGLWAKAFAKQDSVNGHHSRGFEQEAYGINIGFDKLVGTDETSSWLIGAAFRYGTADQEGLGVAGSATGELDEYSVKAYATWMHESGSYADFVLQAGRYDQELKGLDNTGTGSTHADYDTWGYGASIEVGHMFTIANAEDDRPWFNHWFIEPQFELSYFRAQGADYRTSTGMKVEQDDADFLTGRAGLVIGKKFNYGTADDLDKRYFQAALIGGVKHEFLGGDQTIHYTGVDNVKLSAKADDIAGTRVYYGVNMDWQLAQNLRLFGEVSREEGDGYTKDYDVSIGLKYSF